MTGIIELAVVIGIVSLIVFFRKPLQGLLISAKRKADKHTKTSIKIDLAIKDLKTTQTKQKDARNLCNLNRAKLEIQAHRELETAVKIGDLRVVVKDDVTGRPKNGGAVPRLTKGEEYDVVGFSEVDSNFFDIGKSTKWKSDLFDIVSTNKNTNRYMSLRKLMVSYDRRADKLEELVTNIDHKIESLKNDKDYVMTMESLIDIEQFDSVVDSNIDSILAEVSAIEKELELEEKLNGSFVEDDKDESTNI